MVTAYTFLILLTETDYKGMNAAHKFVVFKNPPPSEMKADFLKGERLYNIL